jgi:hypothetical protein
MTSSKYWTGQEQENWMKDVSGSLSTESPQAETPPIQTISESDLFLRGSTSDYVIDDLCVLGVNTSTENETIVFLSGPKTVILRDANGFERRVVLTENGSLFYDSSTVEEIRRF